MPVFGAVLLVLYAEKETLVAKFLSTKVFVSLGLVSYSAYLWHQPVFAFFRIYTNQISLHWLLALVLIIITFLLSYVSWRFVEAPFRNRNLINKCLLFVLSSIALMSLLAIGYASKQGTICLEFKLAKQLSENDFVYFENLNERRFLEGRLLYPMKPVDSIIVGSSRVMQVNSSIVGENIQSFTVSGASVEDNIAFGLEAFAKLNYKNIYISADPWLINQYDGQNRYRFVSELLGYWNHRMHLNLPPIQFLDSRSRVLANQSINNVFASLRNSLAVNDANKLATDGEVEAYDKKAYDGSHIYSVGYVTQTNNIEVGFAGLLNYAMAEFEYDNESVENLKNFVLYLQKNGVNVTLILSPYHPQLYQMMATKKPIFLEIENWYREFADKNSIRIIGSYDGNAVGCKENEFYDGMHPKGSCMQKLFLGVNE
ncbi:acyltransferase [Alphaproteobacteria bacterium]|nr:acyltransferase [Alphaproteobacteria bacterium]